MIGGGIAGLSCAATLQKSGKFLPTVFDTGRLRPGGRSSSRLPGDRPKDGDTTQAKTPIMSNSLYDHAAQMITVSQDGHFYKQVTAWETDGILKRYPPNSVYEIVKKGSSSLTAQPLNDSIMYHGTHGMGSIPLAIAKEGGFAIEQDVWVPPSSGVKYMPSTNQWKVKGKTPQTFDRLVIAHNGKCADRLMSKTPAKALHSLLRVNFNPTVPAHGGKRMTLNSIYSLTFCLPSPNALSNALPNDLITAFVPDNKELQCITCQTRKYPENNDQNVQVWTILSSPKFAKRHKAPQENLPEEVIENVTDLLLESLEQLLDVSLRSSVMESRLQLWGAAVPLNTYGKDGFVYDAEYCVGVCGDWLLEPSIAGAWESGRRLAEYMVTDSGSHSVGLPPKDGAQFQVASGVSEAGIASLQTA